MTKIFIDRNGRYDALDRFRSKSCHSRYHNLTPLLRFCRSLIVEDANLFCLKRHKNMSAHLKSDSPNQQIFHDRAFYLPDDTMALSLGGTKSFLALTPDRWRNFAHRARLPEGAVKRAVAETMAAVHDKWWTLSERDVVSKPVLEHIDKHISSMLPILDPGFSPPPPLRQP
jgi:hypothetical protein